MSYNRKIAIVIPVGPAHDRFIRCLKSCQAIVDDNFVTVVVSDAPVDVVGNYGAINVVTGSVVMTGPAVKRDFAVARIAADLYAFLDDDAYVEPDWLQRVRRVVAANPEVAAFGGPGLMPDDQSFSEELSAATMESNLGGGSINYRFRMLSKRFCDDFPAFNFLVRAEWLGRVGGWGSSLYGGEDTLICSKLHDAGATILYDPILYVRHYRRTLIPKHAWQVYNIGRSRACFIREGQKTSLKTIYFAPLVFSLAVGALLFSMLLRWSFEGLALALGAVFFLGVVVFDGGDNHKIMVRLALPFGIVVQHFAYAYGFVVGLLSGKRNSIAGGSRPTYQRES